MAAVIAMAPKLLILDEPDAGLDIIVYNELYDLLNRIRKETGASILLISHREEAGLIADSATLLWQGKSVLSGDFRKVMQKYCAMSGRKKICQRGCIK